MSFLQNLQDNILNYWALKDEIQVEATGSPEEGYILIYGEEDGFKRVKDFESSRSLIRYYNRRLKPHIDRDEAVSIMGSSEEVIQMTLDRDEVSLSYIPHLMGELEEGQESSEDENYLTEEWAVNVYETVLDFSDPIWKSCLKEQIRDKNIEVIIDADTKELIGHIDLDTYNMSSSGLVELYEDRMIDVIGTSTLRAISSQYINEVESLEEIGSRKYHKDQNDPGQKFYLEEIVKLQETEES